MERLKNCASSPNDIASRLAGEALIVLGESVPHRLSQQIPLWTVQDVKHWMQQVKFGYETSLYNASQYNSTRTGICAMRTV